MPISRGEFEKGELDPGLLILEFLRSNPDYAYIMEELIGELAKRGMDLTAEEAQSILSSLESRGRVEAKTIHGILYL